MSDDSPARFQLAGRFSGLVRDFFGKRRMVLRIADDVVYMKAPKALRRQLDGVLVAGQEIVVAGQHSPGGRGLRVVSQVWIAGNPACVSCPVRVCVKKSCWRNGGRELWAAFEQKVAEDGLEAVNCLDDCKRGPNAECGGDRLHHATPQDARQILARFAEP